MRLSSDTQDHVRILELGVACRATIVQSQTLGMRDRMGDDLYALVLTIGMAGRAPFQIQVRDRVSAAASALLYPGNTLPAKRMPDGDDREIVLDWTLALAQAAGRPD